MFKRKTTRKKDLTMKDLDKIIQENRQEFDIYEPNDGHFERFEQKLKTIGSKKKIFTFGYILKAAAVALLLVLSGLWVYENLESKTNNGIALSEISPEYGEVEMYYTNLVNQKFDEINRCQTLDSTQRLILTHELTEMDSIYETLKMDLTTNPSDQRIINAMIQHYQLKVEIMGQILKQLQQAQEINKQKYENHESTNI